MRLYQYNLQAVRVLLHCAVNSNITNLDGKTAQGMSQESNSEIRDMLRYDGVFSCFCLTQGSEKYRKKVGVLFVESSNKIGRAHV